MVKGKAITRRNVCSATNRVTTTGRREQDLKVGAAACRKSLIQCRCIVAIAHSSARSQLNWRIPAFLDLLGNVETSLEIGAARNERVKVRAK